MNKTLLDANTLIAAFDRVMSITTALADTFKASGDSEHLLRARVHFCASLLDPERMRLGETNATDEHW